MSDVTYHNLNYALERCCEVDEVGWAGIGVGEKLSNIDPLLEEF